MPRGDELEREYKLSDRDDESDDLGYGGGSSFDEDEDEDGGWVLNPRPRPIERTTSPIAQVARGRRLLLTAAAPPRPRH
jgi:hypothetical protein